MAQCVTTQRESVDVLHSKNKTNQIEGGKRRETGAQQLYQNGDYYGIFIILLWTSRVFV